MSMRSSFACQDFFEIGGLGFQSHRDNFVVGFFLPRK